jgi:isoleucyl-tRNA synthetase
VTLHLAARDAELVRSVDFAELCIVAGVDVVQTADSSDVGVAISTDPRCARCWRHIGDVDAETALCGRCSDAVAEAGVAQ